jgi:hypothetical protein
MLVDELHEDPDLDHALRALLPTMPRSRSWERERRAELLAYMATSKVSTANEDTGEKADVEYIHLETPTELLRPSARVLIAAAAVALLVGTLALSTRSHNDDGSAPLAASTVPTPTTVPSLPVTPMLPDRFPVLPATDRRAAQATAIYGSQLGWNNPTGAHALVAKLADATMTGAVDLSAVASFDATGLATQSDQSYAPTPPPETMTIAGVAMTVYSEPGSLNVKIVVAPGTPTLVARGREAVAFLEAAGGFPILGPRIDPEGNVTFALGPLPTGYETFIAPKRLPLGSISAVTNAPDGDGGDGISAWVAIDGPLSGFAPSENLHRVDINGLLGWMGDPSPGAVVLWPVSDTTWAYIGGASNADAALEFARALTFVDEATWRQSYNVAEPDFDTKEQATRTPPTTNAEPTELIISRRTAPADEPIPTPLGCRKTPYTDNSIQAPLTASEPAFALASFLNGPSGAFLMRLGYEEISVSPTRFRYDVRNNQGNLVTVVIVDAVKDGWAATRWLASPC